MLTAHPQRAVSEAMIQPSFNRSGPMDCPFFKRKVNQRTSAVTLLISVSLRGWNDA